VELGFPGHFTHHCYDWYKAQEKKITFIPYLTRFTPNPTIGPRIKVEAVYFYLGRDRALQIERKRIGILWCSILW